MEQHNDTYYEVTVKFTVKAGNMHSAYRNIEKMTADSFTAGNEAISRYDGLSVVKL